MTRITLTLEDFRRLIRGEAVERDGVGVLLGDIGFPVMIKEVLDAAHGLDPELPRTASVPTRWMKAAGYRMDAAFWVEVAPRVYDLIAQGEDEEEAVIRAADEYRTKVATEREIDATIRDAIKKRR